MITIQELIDELNQIKDKSKTIGIAEWNKELGCYECSNTVEITSKEIISYCNRSSIYEYDYCDYYLES